MTEFQYAGTTADGKPCRGVVRAPNAELARMQLIGQGITPVRVGSEALASEVAGGGGAARAPRLRRADVLLFTREMAHLKQANMPLDRSLAMLREIAVNDRLRAFVARVEGGVREGKSLYHALLPFEPDLGRQYLVLIRAGEASGALHTVLAELSSQLEEHDRLRNHVISSMTYPLILTVVAILSVILLLAFVVPQFREIFDSMGDALPYSTRLVIDTSDFLRTYWMGLLAALAALALGLSRWHASTAGRLAVDARLLSLPLVGKVVRNLQFSMYFRTFGVLLQRGVPLVDALRIAVDTLTNTALRRDLEPLVGVVKAGRRLSTGFGSAHFAGTSTPQLIRVAEETGRLETTCLDLAVRYEEEGRRTMARVLAALEPLIIITLGVVVAFIIIAILGGVLSINDTI